MSAAPPPRPRHPRLESNARVLLGVGAGIAAYKSLELVRRLRGRGHEVRVVMTEAATHLIGPASFQAVSGQPVRCALWDPAAEAAMGHIELARWADLLLIAPATADLIARLAAGLADDLLTTLCLASTAPLVLAPAMNQAMWRHPATQANLARLAERGVAVLGPDEGAQACGDVGPGRMLEPEQLLLALSAPGPLQGRRVVVSAGPTYEDLDPVRFLGNRSSGRMGFALAAEAARRGAEVVLLAGPVPLATPPGVNRIDVRTALELLAAAEAHAPGSDVFVGAAAVADYRPARVHGEKLKRDGGSLTLELIPNPDVIARVAALTARPRLVVGFAAETGDLLGEARRKLEQKGLDLVCANRVGRDLAFDRDDNELVVVERTGVQHLPRASKRLLAAQLWDLLQARLGERA